jgi:hypothetical protein
VLERFHGKAKVGKAGKEPGMKKEQEIDAFCLLCSCDSNGWWDINRRQKLPKFFQ